MMGDTLREYRKHRDAYRRSILAYEQATAALAAASAAVERAFKAMQDASATFHEFCDAQAREEDA